MEKGAKAPPRRRLRTIEPKHIQLMLSVDCAEYPILPSAFYTIPCKSRRIPTGLPSFVHQSRPWNRDERNDCADRDRLLAVPNNVPARDIPEVRKQGMDAGLSLRIAEVEFVFAILTRYGIHGAHADGLHGITAG